MVAPTGDSNIVARRWLVEVTGCRVRQSVELETEEKRKYFLKWTYKKSVFTFLQRSRGRRWAGPSSHCLVRRKFTNSIACLHGRVTLLVNPCAVGRPGQYESYSGDTSTFSMTFKRWLLCITLYETRNTRTENICQLNNLNILTVSWAGNSPFPSLCGFKC